MTVEHFRFRRRSIRGSLKEGSVPALVAADFTNIHPTLTGTNGLDFNGVLQNPAPDHPESAAISDISNRFVYSTHGAWRQIFQTNPSTFVIFFVTSDADVTTIDFLSKL